MMETDHRAPGVPAANPGNIWNNCSLRAFVNKVYRDVDNSESDEPLQSLCYLCRPSDSAVSPVSAFWAPPVGREIVYVALNPPAHSKKCNWVYIPVWESVLLHSVWR